MDILVKNTNRKFLPVILGTDANAYGIAKSFHKEYGITSLSLGKAPLLETKKSNIVKVMTFHEFDHDDNFVKYIEEVGKTYHQYYEHLLLIACGDRYTELIVNHRDVLDNYFVTNYISNEMKEKLENKEDFYQICEEYGLDYPKTFIITKANKDNFTLPFDFPVAAKASNSIEYVDLEFEGKKKGYRAENMDELRQILDAVYNAGYTGSMIIQDFIPGDDSTMYVLNSYSDRDGKVKMMCLGHCVSEDYTPHGIGNYNAIVQQANKQVYARYQKFLEDMHYTGFSNFDMKYDVRDGKFKVFEINIRQGRSSYFTTASGCNLVKYLVDDLIEHKQMETHYHDNPYLWLHIPPKLLLKYVSKDSYAQVKQLIQEKKYDTTLLYKEDRSLFRAVMIRRFYHMAYKNFKLYFNKRGI